MKCCCFFGHRKLYADISCKLELQIEDLILNNNVKGFYVGNNGAFDMTVIKILDGLSKKHNITYNIVIAYLPAKQESCYPYDISKTLYPEGIEKSPKRFAISRRNEWMIEHSDYVISYVTNSYGGANKYTEIARRKGKKTINIADTL
ncbi:MAG: hypothetical protein IKT46_03925 [Clostridia bacterium]|nr:hypothetical protein [Clostridia bacterium]